MSGGDSEQTERRSALPPGWLDHREFIRGVSRQIDPGWTGTEHVALPPSQQMLEFEQINDDEATEAYLRQVRSSIDQILASTEPAVSGQPPCAVCGGPSREIIAGRGYCCRHGGQKRRALVDERNSLSATKNEQIVNAGREILWAEIEARYEPERLARNRWNRAYAAVRDQVFGDKLRPAAWCMGEMHWPAVSEWREHYPGPRELRVELPSLPLPAWIAFRRADVTLFEPAATERRQRLFWRPDLKLFMQRNATRLAKLNDDDIASLFRRWMTESHPQIELPRRSRIAKQVASIRIDSDGRQ